MNEDNKEPKEGDLQVWWIPQIPMESFKVNVKTPAEALKILTVLAEYDLFQYHHNIKPDYSNAGGLWIFEDGDWVDWCDENGADIYDWKQM